MLNALRSFRKDDRAAAAVEFAMIGGLFILSILFVLIVAMILFLGQALDYATQKAARQVMTGAVQGSGVNQTSFRTTILCPLLPASISCDDVIVNLYTVPQAAQPNGYYAFTNGGNAGGLIIPPLSNAAGQFSPGIQGQYEYLLVVYPVSFLPAAFASMLGLSTYKGQAAFPIISTAAFRNEQY